MVSTLNKISLPIYAWIIFSTVIGSFLFEPASAEERFSSKMIFLPAGEFIMGGEGKMAKRDEMPRHKVYVDAFWMDKTEVTNAQFARFVRETGYITTAEKPISFADLKKELPPYAVPGFEVKNGMLKPGSLVFVQPAEKNDSDDPKQMDHTKWWKWVEGADWRHPFGPDSSIVGKEDHPVTQVSFADAQAFCKWAQKRLPTEGEWEYAAKLSCENQEIRNIWQGSFPCHNEKPKNKQGTCSVLESGEGSNGLLGMAGNVWEWCQDNYRPTAYLEAIMHDKDSNGVVCNPKGPKEGSDRRYPLSQNIKVIRGGSFLCHESYCAGYRPTARMSATADSAMPHLGFRCVCDKQLDKAAN